MLLQVLNLTINQYKGEKAEVVQIYQKISFKDDS